MNERNIGYPQKQRKFRAKSQRRDITDQSLSAAIFVGYCSGNTETGSLIDESYFGESATPVC